MISFRSVSYAQSTVEIYEYIDLVKYLPRWFSFQRKARVGRKMIETIVVTPFERVKHEMVSATSTTGNQSLISNTVARQSRPFSDSGTPIECKRRCPY